MISHSASRYLIFSSRSFGSWPRVRFEKWTFRSSFFGKSKFEARRRNETWEKKRKAAGWRIAWLLLARDRQSIFSSGRHLLLHPRVRVFTAKGCSVTVPYILRRGLAEGYIMGTRRWEQYLSCLFYDSSGLFNFSFSFFYYDLRMYRKSRRWWWNLRTGHD